MGHAKEIITMDVYGDNSNIIEDGVPEINAYLEAVSPNLKEMRRFKEELLEVTVDVTEWLPENA